MQSLLFALCPLVTATETSVDLNRVSELTSMVGLVSTSSPTLDCVCDRNITDHFLEHAKLMKLEIQNKTSLISKIRHRTTHSSEAVWASLSLSCVVVLLALGVLQSRMWAHRPHISSMDSQPVRFVQYNSMAEIKVKELLRSRGRALLGLFPGRREGRVRQPTALRMETFLSGQGDSVDSSHQALLVSSSEEEWEEEDEEEDVVFSINRRTGEWEGEEKETLLSSRRSSSSSYSSSCGGFNSSVSRDLVRLSSEEDSEEELMVKVG